MDKEYCPTQLRPDPVFPTHLHVLSNCFHDHYFYSSPYIYTYDVAHREYLGKSLIDVSYSKNLKAQINFCPFSDSFVLHAPEQNSLVILPRVQSIQRLETSLAQLGFAKKSSFSCLSNLGSYAIFGQSLESSESNIYGIFSGGMGLNFEKFVNRIWRDFEPGSRHIPTTFTTAR